MAFLSNLKCQLKYNSLFLKVSFQFYGTEILNFASGNLETKAGAFISCRARAGAAILLSYDHFNWF